MIDYRTENRTPGKERAFAEILEGEPLQVEGRELVPLVRVTSRVKRRAHLSGETVGGHGYGFLHMRPVAILDRSHDDEQCHQIPNATVRILVWLGLITVVLPPLTWLAIHLARKGSNGRS